MNNFSGKNLGSNPNMGGYGMNKIPKGYQLGQLQQFDPQQMSLYNRSFNSVSPDSYLSRLAAGDQGLFDEMEAPDHRQFAELLGGLSSRFSGMGTGGRHSSGFKNASTAAASNFSQDLASRRQMLMQQAIKDLHGMTNDLLGLRPMDQFLVQKPQKENNWSAGFGNSIGQGLGGLLSGLFK